MTTVPCPGCSAPLALAQEVCPACRRPRGADEVELGRREAAAAHERRKALPLKLLGWVGLFAAFAALYVNRTALLAHAARLRAGFDAEMEKASDPARLSRRPPESAVSDVAPPRAEASAPAAAPAQPPPAEASPAEPPPPPGAPANNMCRFYGVVYDLETLRPAANVNIRFTRKGGEVHAATNTNAAGHYVIDFYLDDLDQGILLSISAPGYREGQLAESGASYRERPIDSRKRTAAETTDADLGPLLLPGGGTQIVPLDLVLLPKRP